MILTGVCVCQDMAAEMELERKRRQSERMQAIMQQRMQSQRQQQVCDFTSISQSAFACTACCFLLANSTLYGRL